MAIIFARGSCGKRFKTKDEWAGRRTKCPTCSTDIEVPGQDEMTTRPGLGALENPSDPVSPWNGEEPSPLPDTFHARGFTGEPWNVGQAEHDLPEEPSEALEIPGLQVEIEHGYEAPMRSATPPALLAAYPQEPWYYLFVWISDMLTCSLAAVAAIVALSIGLFVMFSDSPTAFLFWIVPLFWAAGMTAAGGTILLAVDVARNIRRLRQHADRNAGIQ